MPKGKSDDSNIDQIGKFAVEPIPGPVPPYKSDKWDLFLDAVRNAGPGNCLVVPYTFIKPDILRSMMSHMKARGKLLPGEAVHVQARRGDQFSRVWISKDN